MVRASCAPTSLPPHQKRPCWPSQTTTRLYASTQGPPHAGGEKSRERELAGPARPASEPRCRHLMAGGVRPDFLGQQFSFAPHDGGHVLHQSGHQRAIQAYFLLPVKRRLWQVPVIVTLAHKPRASDQTCFGDGGPSRRDTRHRRGEHKASFQAPFIESSSCASNWQYADRRPIIFTCEDIRDWVRERAALPIITDGQFATILRLPALPSNSAC